MEETTMVAVFTTVMSTRGDLWLLPQEVLMELVKKAQKSGILPFLDPNGNLVSIEKTENTLNLKGYAAKDSIWSSFNQYFFLFQAEPLLIEMRNGAKMSTTAQGDGLIMTYGKGVYSFKCTSEIKCKWSKESFDLQISRQDHAMLPVPMSFLENCG